MQSLIDTLACLDKSLDERGGSTLFVRMSYYDNKMAEFNRDFYTTPINSDPQIKKMVQRILSHLNVPACQWSRYLDAPLSVYDFLVELAESNTKQYKKINAFIELIHDQNRLKWLKVIFTSAAVLIIVETTLPFIAPIVGLTTIQELLAAALFAPVVGTLYTAGVAIYSLYTSLYDRNMSFFQRFRDNFFLLAHAALKFAAYGLLIATVTTATVIPAILFVVAAVVLVLKEVSSLVHMVFQDKKRPIVTDEADLGILQEEARHAYDYKKQRNSVLINMVAAVACVGLVAVMCFVPGGIFVTVGVLAAIGLVYLAKTWAHKHNETTIRAGLQRKFSDIEFAYEERHGLQKGDGLVLSDDYQKQAQSADSLHITSEADLLPLSSKQATDDRLSRSSLRGMFAYRKPLVVIGPFDVQTEAMSNVTL